MMATKLKRVKSRRKTTSCLLTPAPGSTETQWWALSRNNRVVKLSGLSKNPTTGDILLKSGGRSEKSLSRSRLKSEHCGMLSRKTISNQSLPPKGVGIATRNSHAAIARESVKSEHLAN